MIVGQDWA